jgi:hypothetical protein
MLGNKVTDFDKFTNGAYGYTIVLDTTDILLNKPDFIQVDDNGTTSDPIVGPTDLETLQGYINDVDAPDAAWSFASDLLIMFFNATSAPYSSTTRFVIYGYRNNQPITSLSDSIDIKDRDIGWFTALAIKEAAIMQGKMIPKGIEKEITQYEAIVQGGG